jgi:hypothetical protein
VKYPEPIFATLANPSEIPSINPNHAADAPSVARNAGKTALAVSCDQSLKSDANPMPNTVRLSHPFRSGWLALESFTASMRRAPLNSAQQTILQHFQVARRMPRHDAPKRKRGNLHRVHRSVKRIVQRSLK